MIKVETFFEELKRIYPTRKFTQMQMDFFKFAIEIINTDRDTQKLTAFAARCGLGKSSFLHLLIRCWLKDNEDRGLIIVTDNLQRLAEMYDDADKRIAFLTAENKETEMVRQLHCPILLMTTQRYFQMESIERFLSYYRNGDKHCRDTVIFDEQPYFYTDNEIGVHEINLLHSALSEGITDLCTPSDKSWALAQYNACREKLIDTINYLENKRNKTTYLFYHPEFDRITEDDIKFYSIINSSLTEIDNKYPTAKRILHDLSFFLKNGGFFSSSKLKDNNDYHKRFIVRHDFKEKFLFGREVKTFVFDATASISELYPDDAEWLNILDCEDYTVPLDYMNIHIIDVNTSRNALINKSDRNFKIFSIKNYIKELSLDTEDTLFVTYKTLLQDGTFDDIGFSVNNSLYFGNTRGFNHNNNKHTFIQIGLHRQSNINYLLSFLSNNKDFELRIKNDTVGIEANIAEMDSLLKSDLVDGYICAEVAADIVQNIFRTKAREVDNQDKIDVYLFCVPSENLMIELQYALGRYGANIEIEKLDDLQAFKIKNRKGEANTKKIIVWLDTQSKGRTFSTSEMTTEIGITTADFKTVKKNNQYIKERFDAMKIPGTRGKYLVS